MSSAINPGPNKFAAAPCIQAPAHAAEKPGIPTLFGRPHDTNPQRFDLGDIIAMPEVARVILRHTHMGYTARPKIMQPERRPPLPLGIQPRAIAVPIEDHSRDWTRRTPR